VRSHYGNLDRVGGLGPHLPQLARQHHHANNSEESLNQSEFAEFLHFFSHSLISSPTNSYRADRYMVNALSPWSVFFIWGSHSKRRATPLRGQRYDLLPIDVVISCCHTGKP
jgi:hypothetical protein